MCLPFLGMRNVHGNDCGELVRLAADCIRIRENSATDCAHCERLSSGRCRIPREQPVKWWIELLIRDQAVDGKTHLSVPAIFPISSLASSCQNGAYRSKTNMFGGTANGRRSTQSSPGSSPALAFIQFASGIRSRLPRSVRMSEIPPR